MGPGLAPGTLSAAPPPHALNTDRWFYGVFQSAPDLIRWLAEPSPGLDASLGAVPLELDRQYRFSAPELKAGSHRLDGVLWPLGSETGSEELPVVLLEVQMRADIGFHHRLAAQTYRFLQLHPRIEHLAGGGDHAAPAAPARASEATAEFPGAGALGEPGGARPTGKPGCSRGSAHPAGAL